MPFQAVRNRSLADDVFSQLIGEIIRGQYKPGDNLPPERTLTDVFQVNRHVVREALKRLQQLGVVAISQGGGTKVLDYREHAGIDMLQLLGEHLAGSPEGLLLWRSVLEMRAAIAVDMVRLCTLRASQEVRDDLVAIADELQRSKDASREHLYRLEVRFWYRVVDGCDNLAYRLALNGVLRGDTIDADLTFRLSAWETRAASYRVPLAAAIASGDVVAAESEVRTTMRDALHAFYERVMSDTSTTPSVAMPSPEASSPAGPPPIPASEHPEVEPGNEPTGS